MKPTTLTLLCLTLLCLPARAQTLAVEGVTALAADRQGCCYVVAGSSVAKYSATLALQARYTCPLGSIASIDASDPFKVALFCKDFLRIVLLDSKLAQLGNPLFLPDLNALRPTAACRSAENGLWVADAYRRRLLYLDFTLNTSREAALLGDEAAEVCCMVEREAKVFAGFAGGNLAIFDKFGALLHLLPVPVPCWFDVQGDLLYYLANGNLYTQNLHALSEAPALVATGVERCAVGHGALYTYAKGLLTVKK
ncbi:MAG: hypothetical protein LBS63_03875 [Prevotellaceae bacterium]|jgi:hypothetical protein|nr:hypothetical protein [Prevotellaceae bacterium]